MDRAMPPRKTSKTYRFRQPGIRSAQRKRSTAAPMTVNDFTMLMVDESTSVPGHRQAMSRIAVASPMMTAGNKIRTTPTGRFVAVGEGSLDIAGLESGQGTTGL